MSALLVFVIIGFASVVFFVAMRWRARRWEDLYRRIEEDRRNKIRWDESQSQGIRDDCGMTALQRLVDLKNRNAWWRGRFWPDTVLSYRDSNEQGCESDGLGLPPVVKFPSPFSYLLLYCAILAVGMLFMLAMRGA